MIDRLCDDWQIQGLLFIGDCKRALLAKRAHIHHRQQTYLPPLAQVGDVPAELADWVQRALDGDVRLLPLVAEDGSAWGEGYQAILDKYRVAGLLSVRLHHKVERRQMRAYGDRPARVEEQNRYVVQVWRNASVIQQHARTVGWRAYATNVPRRQMSLSEGIQCYADLGLLVSRQLVSATGG